MKSGLCIFSLIAFGAVTTSALAGGPVYVEERHTVIAAQPGFPVGGNLRVEPERHRPVFEPICIDLSVDRPEYEFGDEVRVRLRVDEDSYVYLFSEEPCGTVRQIFPNCFDNDNFLRAHRTYRLPGHGYDFVVRSVEGTETLRAVASSVPLEWLDHEFRRSTHHDPFPRASYSYTEITSRVSESLSIHYSGGGHGDSFGFSYERREPAIITREVRVEPRGGCDPCGPVPAYGEAAVSFCIVKPWCPPVHHYSTEVIVHEYHRPAPIYKPLPIHRPAPIHHPHYVPAHSTNISFNFTNVDIDHHGKKDKDRDRDRGHGKNWNNDDRPSRPTYNDGRLQPVTNDTSRGRYSQTSLNND